MAAGQHTQAGSWQALLDKGKVEEARRLCEDWTKAKDLPKHVEAEKCLANVELSGRSVLTLQGDDVGGGSLSGGYQPEAVDKALRHLETALKLAPQDLSVHQGRLHLLEVSARYDDMAKALSNSLEIYTGPEGVDAWIPYTAELFELGQYRASLKLLDILNKHSPNSHDVIGNIGAIHLKLKEDQEAIPFLEKAVELAPLDTIDVWNLARAYDFAGKDDLAEKWYKRALEIDSAQETRKHKACVYATFVENKRHDLNAACELQTANCDKDEQSACSATKH